MQVSNTSPVEATIRKLQEQILDDTVPLPSILRLANVLAYQLSNPTLKEWVQQEQDGYQCKLEDLPDYRKLRVESYGTFAGAYGQQIRNAAIPAAALSDEFLQEIATTAVFRGGVTELQELLSAEGDPLMLKWPNDCLMLLQWETLYEGMTAVEAWKPVTKSAILQILDTIRNRLLNTVLELQDISFDIAQHSTPEKQEQVTNIINNFLFDRSPIYQGDSMSVFDQRGQSVNYQYNAAGNINFGNVQNRNDVIDQLEELRLELRRAKDANVLDEEQYVEGSYHVGKAIEEAKSA